jgi:hypothetical protein
MFELEVFISEFFTIDAKKNNRLKSIENQRNIHLPFTTGTITDEMKRENLSKEKHLLSHSLFCKVTT